MKIIFEHSGVFDEYVAKLQGKALDEEMLSKVESFLPTLNDHWQRKGARLLDAACEISGFDFKLSESRCTVTVGEFVSISHPFIVNISKHLDSLNFDALEEVVFHEALHILLTDNWKVWPTELVKEHGQANPEIEAHLHLMSIELATHQQLGHAERLEWIDSWYERIGVGYKAAWQTINTGNLYRKFLRELRDSKQWQVRRMSPANSEETQLRV